MKKLESNPVNMICVLTVIAVVCGALLALVKGATDEPIRITKEKALNEGISAVLGGDAGKALAPADTVKRSVDNKEQTFIVYKMEKGTAVQSTDPNGFGGNLSVLVGFDNEGTIKGYTILETAETPGLGAKADTWFKENPSKPNAVIIGKNPGKCNMTVSKDGGDIDAITASTITSRAFLRAVQQAYNTFNEKGADANTGATTQENK